MFRMWDVSTAFEVPIIQKQLGHANLATTQRYLDHIAPKDVVEVMQQREWRVP